MSIRFQFSSSGDKSYWQTIMKSGFQHNVLGVILQKSEDRRVGFAFSPRC